MSHILPDSVRQRALDFIAHCAVEKLSVLERAQLLFALNDDAATQQLRSRLINQLQTHLLASWFKQADLTTIFMTLSALLRHRPDLIDGGVMARAAQRLVAAEVALGGPYADQDQTVTLPAQLAIAISMQQVGTSLPNVSAAIREGIAPRSFMRQGTAAYLWLWYAAYLHDPELKLLISGQLLRHRVDGKWGSFTATLLAQLTSNTLQQEAAITPIRASIITEQLADGSWPADELPGFSTAGGTLFLTILVLQLSAEAAVARQIPPYDQRALSVTQSCHRDLQKLPSPLIAVSAKMLHTVEQADAEHEITLLPYFFNQALQKPVATDEQLLLLGKANVFAWMAYVIYDDFLDDEGNPQLLSTANVAHRLALDYYDRITSPGGSDVVTRTFNELDAANAWEIEHCRFKVVHNRITIGRLPDFGDLDILAQRTAIHTLGTHILLDRLNIPAENTARQQITKAFRHYLIARQLNDDIHDWLKDLQAGQITYVVTVMLQKMAVKAGETSLDALLLQARHTFWQETLLEISGTALKHITTARQLFTESQLLRPDNAIYGFLDSMAAVVQDGLAKRQQGLDFLSVFGNDRPQSGGRETKQTS